MTSATNISSQINDAAWQHAIDFLEKRPHLEQQIPGTIDYAQLETQLAQLKKVVAALGYDNLPFAVLHVAGTKGKGSTCVMLEQILRASKYHVGRFSSPHLHAILERFCIDGEPISAADFIAAVERLRARLEKLEAENETWKSIFPSLSFFDLTFLLACDIFQEKLVEVMVCEVGMGGRFDSTNACDPLLSIITSISYDHLEELGPTLADIAREKAGIIRAGIQVVSGVRLNEPREVIRSVAQERGAPLRELGGDFACSVMNAISSPISFSFREFNPHDEKMPLAVLAHVMMPCWGEHQIRNAALAIDAAHYLASRGWHISDLTIRKGLSQINLPARIEFLKTRPTFVIDGAHNRASVASLVETLTNLMLRGKKILVFGTTLGKDVEGMFQELFPFFDRILLTQYPNNVRAFPARALLTVAAGLVASEGFSFDEFSGDEDSFDKCELVEDCLEAVTLARNAASDEDDLVCVTGSMYLAAFVRRDFLANYPPKNRGE